VAAEPPLIAEYDVVMLNVLLGLVFTVGSVGAAGRMTGTAAEAE
jgi:hypothetical protein